VSNNARPTDSAEEWRWEQPSFTEAPQPGVVSGPVLQPRPVRHTTPPSRTESLLRLASGLVWPVAILVAIFTDVSVATAVFAGLAISIALHVVRRTLQTRRQARPPRPESR
jgi:hypothetical protein